MIEREWFFPETCAQIKTLTDTLPETILIQMCDIIETMGTMKIYRNSLIKLVYSFVVNEHGVSHCSASETYDCYHEFCMLLDGWVWSVKSPDNTEYGTYALLDLPNNAVAE